MLCGRFASRLSRDCQLSGANAVSALRASLEGGYRDPRQQAAGG